ncbi:MAG: pyruvate kinase, partial [Deinococcus sp.]|nr:pyruvate kinase [Deinococcus sp.]
SHGTHETHAAVYRVVREAAARVGVPVAVLQDLQGPKIRLGKFQAGAVTLPAGQEFVLTARDVLGNEREVGLTYPELAREVRPGMKLLLDDGNVQMEVLDSDGSNIRCRVIVGGRLSDHKGINVPEADLSTPALTEKDLGDLAYGAELGVDWVAISFVRRPEDVALARQELAKAGSEAKLMAKIEKPGAVRTFSQILELADGVMVARGDLGVELDSARVPMIQKALIAQCNTAGKPVITATQMLESMVQAPRPTRAEASDVANAVLDGTDAVMLSAETAVGAHPVEATACMASICLTTEQTPAYHALLAAKRPPARGTVQDAVAAAACKLAADIGAGAIITFTGSGSTALSVSRFRPLAPVIAVVPNDIVRYQLALAWGVVPLAIDVPRDADTDQVTREVIKVVDEGGWVDPGDRVVITAGVPFGHAGTTNLIRVAQV